MTPPLPFRLLTLTLLDVTSFMLGRELRYSSSPRPQFVGCYLTARHIPRHEGRCRSPPSQMFAPFVSPRPPALPRGLPLPQPFLLGCSFSPAVRCTPSPLSNVVVNRVSASNILLPCAVRLLMSNLVQRGVPYSMFRTSLLVISSFPLPGHFPHLHVRLNHSAAT